MHLGRLHENLSMGNRLGARSLFWPWRYAFAATLTSLFTRCKPILFGDGHDVVGAGFAEALELACFAYLLFFYFVRIHGN